MGRLINILCSILLGLCPWVNVVTVFCRGVVQKNIRWIYISLAYIILQFSLFTGMMSVTSLSDSFKVLIILFMISLVAASVFSVSTLLKNYDGNTFKYVGVALVSGFGSVILGFINIAAILLLFTNKRHLSLLLSFVSLSILILLIVGILPGQFLALIILVNFVMVFSWIFIANNSLLVNLGSSLFNSIIITAQSNSNQPNTSPSVNTSSHQHMNERNNNRREQPIEAGTEVYNKGWTVDDTINMEVNLLTIEDVIFPVMLKNEHEKAMKDLIIYIRKLNKYSDEEIENTFGVGGLSSYLEKFFSKLKLDAVRSVYIHSLRLLIEEYAFRDSRVSVYVEKLVYSQPSSINEIG